MANRNYNSIPTQEEPSVNEIPAKPKFFEQKTKKHRAIAAVVVSVAAALLVTSAAFLFTKEEPVVHEPAKRNVIMMISDGFGPASETFARQYYQWHEKLAPQAAMLPLDEIHVGHSRTQSSSSLVTDSAAGATAFACALKSYNGAIGVDPEKRPCGTVLESAKLHHDMLTGLVVTSRVTHATPASFSAHVAWRDWEPLIAEHQIGYTPLGRTVDLMFGGGSCEFLPNVTDSNEISCRADQRDLFQEAKDNFGWTVHRTRKEFDAIDTHHAHLPLMTVFTPQHMSYEIDRKPAKEPALHEMTEKALDILLHASKEADKGFFLMIEGSRIDMAAHSNDAATHVHEILEYHRTVELVKEFVRANPDTVVISTSDHETGGLTVGRQVGSDYPEYKWNPEVIQRVTNSSEALAGMWYKATVAEAATTKFLKDTLVADGLGVDDATKEELDRILQWKDSGKSFEVLITYFADIVSRRALIGFTTWGHTAVDVNLYAYGPGTERLRGSHENIEIGDFIVDFLGLDLDDITKRLNADDLLAIKAQDPEDYAHAMSNHQRFHD
ncbi:alkaline-phosphatase-like protein [Gongronella butleri]|nr:alkaline-phosphatase-like protein [Gongronella butleri]